MKWTHHTTPENKSKKGWDLKFINFKSLFFPFLGIMSIAVIATSLVTYQTYRNSLEKSLYSEVETRAHNTRHLFKHHLATRLKNLLDQNRSIVEHYKIRPNLHRLLLDPAQSNNTDTLKHELNRKNNDTKMSNISLINKHGRVIFRHGRNSSFSINDLDIKAAFKGEEFSGIIQEEKNWMLRAAVPIQKSGLIQGTLVLSIRLNQVLKEFANENQSKLILADKNGIQARGEASTSIDIDQKKIEQILNDKTMLTDIDFEKERLFHYMHFQLSKHNFVLVSELDLGQTIDILKQKNQDVLKATLYLLMFLLPVSALLVHMLLRPLSILRKRAATVAENLAGISLEEFNGNEINRLLYTFDAMASALETHEDKRQVAEALLQQQHATLEIKVKDRTKKLEEANDLLLHEISERTRSQQKAEDLQKMMASLIDAMPSLLIGIDNNCRINQWNLEAQKYCGLTYAQVSGRPLFDSLPWLSEINEKVNQTLNCGIQNKITRFRWSTSHGERLVDIMINSLSSKQYGGAVIRIDDVTERIRLDELIMQTEKMMSVGGLAAGMAHEINNPLASIIQNTQVITQRLSPGLNKNLSCAEKLGVDLEILNRYLSERQIPKMLVSILESGQRAGEIVKDMVNFTQGDESIQSEQNICEILDRAVEMSTKDYDLKKNQNIHLIKFNRTYANNLSKIPCNPSQLEQVFFNLIKNAAQAMSSWSGMNNPPQIDLTVQKRNNMLAIEIYDNGTGIDIESQKRIFEPFFTTKEVGLGTGLGLSVAYFIITENHHGQLSIDSRLNMGTCFHILLPIQPSQEDGTNS